jgi:hypothetical protein
MQEQMQQMQIHHEQSDCGSNIDPNVPSFQEPQAHADTLSLPPPDQSTIPSSMSIRSFRMLAANSVPAAKRWVKQFFKISPVAEDGILKALGLSRSSETMSRSLYGLLRMPDFWGAGFQWPYHHNKFDSKRVPTEMLDTTIDDMIDTIDLLQQQTAGGIVYLIRPANCSLPGGDTFTKFGKHTLGSSRIEDLKKRGAFKMDWETCALVTLPPSPKSAHDSSTVSQFENGVRFCTKRFLGDGCAIDGCRNEYMYQSNALLAASVIGMEAVATAMNNQLSVRSMIQIFGNAQAVAMHKAIDELPSKIVIRTIGSGHAHDTGSGYGTRTKRNGNGLASGTVYFAKSKSLFCGRTLFKIGASGKSLERMADLYSEQHWCIAFEQIACIEVEAEYGQPKWLHDVEKIVAKNVLQLQPAEFELKGQVLNDEYFLLNSTVKHDITDKIVSAFNRTEPAKKTVGDINRHFKKSLVGAVV